MQRLLYMSESKIHPALYHIRGILPDYRNMGMVPALAVPLALKPVYEMDYNLQCHSADNQTMGPSKMTC